MLRLWTAAERGPQGAGGKGVQFTLAPRTRKDWHVRTAHFHDPDGNVIEINQRIRVPSSPSAARALSATLGVVLVDRFLPAAADRPVDAETLDVRLDVEQRRPVEHVNVCDVKDTTLPPEQPDNTQSNRVRPRRRPRGEDASPYIIKERYDLQSMRLRAVEMEEQDDVREAVEVVQPLLERRIDLDSPLDPPRIARLDRARRRIRMR